MKTKNKRGGEGTKVPASLTSDLTVQQMRRMRGGLEALALWMRDLMEAGLAAAHSQPIAYWDEMGARLVDSELPGLAVLVRAMYTLSTTGEDWAENLLERLGKLYLMIESFRRYDHLSPQQRGDLRSALNCLPPLDSLGGNTRVRDRWHVIGHHAEREQFNTRSVPDWLDDSTAHLHYTWLWGARSGRMALLTAGAWRAKDQKFGLVPGADLEAEVIFYPSAYPQRAALYGLEIEKIIPTPGAIPFTQMRSDSFKEMLDHYAQALAHNPFMERFPALLKAALPAQKGKFWGIQDEHEGIILPLAPGWKFGWDLIAISGGKPFTIFGEWNGKTFLPLSAWANDRTMGWS